MIKAAKGESDIPVRIQAAEERITPNKTSVIRDINKFKPDSSATEPGSGTAGGRFIIAAGHWQTSAF